MSQRISPEEHKKLDDVTPEFEEAAHRGLVESPEEVLEDVNIKAIERLPWDSVEEKDGGSEKDQEETRGDKERDIADIYNELLNETGSRLGTLLERQHPAAEAYNKYFDGMNKVTNAAVEMHKTKSWSREAYVRWMKGQLVLLQILHAELGKLIDKRE